MPFHLKQWGEWAPPTQAWHGNGDAFGSGVTMHDWPDGERSARLGVKRAGRLLDGVLLDAFPEVRA